MAKYMIETKRSDNKAKYLANVYLLKVKGMERTGNEWEFNDRQTAQSVAGIINTTYGFGIWEVVQVIEVDAEKRADDNPTNTEMNEPHAKNNRNTEKNAGARRKTSNRSKSVEPEIAEMQKEEKEGNGQQAAVKISKEEAMIDWYSSIDEEYEGDEKQAEQPEPIKIARNGKIMAAPIRREVIKDE